MELTQAERAGDRAGERGDAPTRQRVARAILELGPSTAATLAERLDLTPAAIRRHLDHLVASGLVESRQPRALAARGRGRPARVFVLTAAGRDQFEQGYDDLAVQALRFLARTAGEDAVTRFAEERLRSLEERAHQLAAADPTRPPAEALAEAMREDGYAATVQHGSPRAPQLCQQHCPVAHVAQEFPQLCDAETAMISRVVGHHVQRLATIAHGDGVCTTVLPARSAARAAPVTTSTPTSTAASTATGGRTR